MKNSLFPSTEIISSFLSFACKRDASLLKAVEKDVKSTIFSISNIDFANTEIQIVKNTETDVALILPYYSELDNTQAVKIPDDEMNIIGGEIVITVLGTLGAIGSAIGIGSFVGGLGAIGYTTSAIIAGALVVATPVLVTAGLTAIGTGVGVTVGNQNATENGK